MKPILFNTEMVRAILEGRKTVTRRIIKPHLKSKYKYKLGFIVDSTDKKQEGCYAFGISELGGRIKCVKPPYKVNDILYVRETWIPKESEENGKLVKGFAYKADFTGYESMFAWRPSIHMPKEAARIFLKVTDVRVERLQDITLDDCHKEGINIETNSITDGETLKRHHDFSMEKFETLWDGTIKKDQLNTYGWNANPYVWVIEFERVEKPAAD